MVGNLGYAELSLGDLDSARRHLLKSLDIARALNDHYGESLDQARRVRVVAGTAYALIGLAMTGNGGARPGRSARLHGEADQVLKDLGETIEPLEGRLRDLDCQRLRSAMGVEASRQSMPQGRP